jgi:uncharacterized membrane protein
MLKVGLTTKTQERTSSLLWWTLVTLTIAAVAELVIWRTFSRIGVFIPKDEPRMAGFRAFYNVSVEIGTIMVNFAVILAVLALFLMIARLRENESLDRIRNRWLVIGLVMTVLVLAASLALLALVENLPASTLLRLALIGAIAGFALDYWRNNRDWTSRLFISLLAWGYIVPLVAKLVADLSPSLGLDWGVRFYEPMLDAGELLVVINGFVVFLVYGSDRKAGHPALQMLRHWPALLGATVLVGAFLALTFVTVAESFIVPILGLYALGYPMHWPLPVYVIALFFLLYTIFYNLGEMRRGKIQRAAALGLILIFCGGYLFSISDQYLFALAGVLLLTRPELAE